MHIISKITSMCEQQKCPAVLKCNIDKIIETIADLKTQRDEVIRTIRRQEEEKGFLASEVERLTYKMHNLNKNLAQRMISRDRYNEAIIEAEEYYRKLVESSGALLHAIQRDCCELCEAMDKKVGPDLLEEETCQKHCSEQNV